MTIVYFDIKTSEFAASAEILQIGAKCREKTFYFYVLPQNEIPAKPLVHHVCYLISAGKSYNWHLNGQAKLLRKAKNLGSLQMLEEIVTKTMRGKMAEQEILFENLKKSFTISGVDGIRMLLGESVNGKPRVTKHVRIINKIAIFMEQHVQNMQIE
ncbi:uncharacterized protein LOC143905526 [Temnothorax americanus]|uniref:uncharacterized protein LOC143905526 n=1 Tax=Temnothorax americanus TaxID=1964332 RepID=UPI004068479E